MAARNPEAGAAPVTAQEFHRLMAQAAPFESHPHIVVAVSGGADSMSLLLLVQHWAKQLGGRVTALTVDHGLRSESGQEALQVKHWCETLGIEHHILAWNPPVLSSAIQARAREARYALLAAWCHAHHVLHMLAAHHLGDQAETLFFRLARGSGLDGLACMPPLSDVHGVRLIRPLLGLAKTRLQATLAAHNQAWIEDPTNQKAYYTRNHIRLALDASGNGEAWCQKAGDIAQRFGVIRNRLENNLASYLTQVVSLFPEGYALLHHKPFVQLAPEYGLRCLAALCLAVSGGDTAPRSEKLQRFYREIVTDRISRRRTFSGLIFIRRMTRGDWLVCREPRAMQGALALTDSELLLWDRRFRASWAGDNNHMTLRALGADGIKLLEKQKDNKYATLEKPVLAALPSFWHLEELASVPHISYTNPAFRHMEFTAGFFPAKPLAARAFFSMNTGTT